MKLDVESFVRQCFLASHDPILKTNPILPVLQRACFLLNHTQPSPQSTSPPQKPVILTSTTSVVSQNLPASKAKGFQVGEIVEVKDDDDSDWRRGVVVNLEPLKIQAEGWEKAYEWDSVRKVSVLIFFVQNMHSKKTT